MADGNTPRDDREYKLRQLPTDGITAVKFAPKSSQFLLVSSWDTSVRLYDIHANDLRLKYEHTDPVLDCCFHDSIHALSGGLDKLVKLRDLNVGTETVLGCHDEAVRCLDYCLDVNLVISGSWDATIKLWDPRQPLFVSNHVHEDKVYTMSVCGDKIIVGTAARQVWIWDLRNMASAQQKRESSLLQQTRCIRAFTNKEGFALSSVEGKVAVEYFDPSPEIQQKNYIFKCHRYKEGNTETIYPVNAIAFHQQYNTFATGGSDGIVNIWDCFNKTKLGQFRSYPTCIASLAFSNDGSKLAIASSYMYKYMDEKLHETEDAIYIRRIPEDLVKPVN